MIPYPFVLPERPPRRLEYTAEPPATANKMKKRSGIEIAYAGAAELPAGRESSPRGSRSRRTSCSCGAQLSTLTTGQSARDPVVVALVECPVTAVVDDGAGRADRSRRLGRLTSRRKEHRWIDIATRGVTLPARAQALPVGDHLGEALVAVVETGGVAVERGHCGSVVSPNRPSPDLWVVGNAPALPSSWCACV